MNPCTNGCQPPRSALFFRCPDRLIDPGSYVPLPPSSRVDPCRMFPSRRHRGSIRVVCFPPAVIAGRSMSCVSLPPSSRVDPCRMSPLLSVSPSRIVLPALCTSFPLPIVIPAPYRHSRDGGNLVTCVRRLSIEAPATRYLHRSGTRCSPQRACYGRTYPVHYTYTNDAAGLVLRRANPPYRGVIEICGFSMAYRPCLLYNLAHCERGGNAP